MTVIREGLAIRRATVADAAIITHHRRRMFEDMGHADYPTMDEMCAVFEVWVREKLILGEYLGWLAVDGDEVVAGGGLAVLEWAPGLLDTGTRRVYIYNVYTEPEYRRRGLARRLITTMLDWCRSENILAISLHASNDGHSLYESLGFKQTNEMRITLT